ncbi:hypothetical protein FEM48_Zijuj01G0075000 [Ziziphus jujuba var. spinosa]|uniref:PGG domain-containing protein n=1 Tax=Ziziphus jujuba var. spinosa TaxID=714518 RepID=A0A978VZX8_ZIZJJ|nr:hypothetical protein FEM48_Zijuj01G0075000 [Ziziphus jujuba var. spinosa]
MVKAVDERKNSKDMYEGLMKGDMVKVLKQYEKLPATSQESSTVLGDTLHHIAIYMDHEDMAREILKKYLHHHRDLISKKNSIGDTVLHEVAVKNMVDLAGDLLDNVPELLSLSNGLGDMPLFKAAANGQLQMFNILSLAVNLKDKDNLDQHLIRNDNTNILHMAILFESFDLAYLIAKKYPHLVDKEDGAGMISLQLLPNNPSAFISSANYGLLKRLIFKYHLQPGFPTFENTKEKEGYKKEDQTDFCQPDSIKDEELYNPKTNGYKNWPPTYNVCMRIASGKYTYNSIPLKSCPPHFDLGAGWPMMKTIYEEYRTHESAFRLAKLLTEQDTTWQENDSKNEKKKSTWQENDSKKEKGKYNSLRPTHPTSLLTATRNGIVEIVKELLRVYPQVVEHESKAGQNILHVAIKYRQLEIFNHVMKMEVAMPRLVKKVDKNGNTILHQVGNIINYSGGTLPGPVLQLQKELRWLERVRNIVPPHYVMLQNKYPEEEEGETADELFLRTNTKLLEEAKEWIKKTSESCSTIAVLIASVAFVAAYTIPRELQHFRNSLPRKLTFSFTFLFISVAVTMLAFAATIMLTIRLKKRWVTTLLYSLAFLPVTLSALLQYPLYLAFIDTMNYSLIAINNSLPALPWSTSTIVSPNYKID